MVEDLGLYSGTKPKPSCYDFSLDLLYPRIVSEKVRHYTKNVRLFIFTPEITVGAFDLSSTSSVLKKELLKIGKIQFAQYQLSDDVDKRWYSSEDKSNAPTVTSGVNINKHTFKDLRDVRRSYPKNAPAINHFLSLI
jgi:hypothetical protein